MAAHPSDPSHRPSKPAPSRVRVRSRRLDEVDEAKLAVALSIMARRLLEQQREDTAASESAVDALDAPAADGREVA